MSRLARDGTAEPVSRDQIVRRERGQVNINFPCLADHVQDWQPYTRLIHTLAYVMTTYVSGTSRNASYYRMKPRYFADDYSKTRLYWSSLCDTMTDNDGSSERVRWSSPPQRTESNQKWTLVFFTSEEVVGQLRVNYLF